MKNKLSKLWNLNTRDFIKGLLVAIITAVLTFLTEVLQVGGAFDADFFKKLAIAATIGFLSYLIKNLLTNSNDQVITKEPTP